MIGSVMHWFHEHLFPPVPQRKRIQAPAKNDLRDASHRLNNETMALRSEVAQSVGGPQNLERLIRRMKEDRECTT
jgi:hypothetical protein